MAEIQNHRGPDHLGVFVHENVGVAHNRLSILDLTDAGNQPFVNDRYVMVYNGEIYNYKKIRQELAAEGAVFRGDSDTTVLFEALNLWGVEHTLRVLEGMFAFSLFDRQTGTVYLCRDRFGIKPLVWLRRENTLYWASEIKAIATVARVDPDPVRSLFTAASIADESNVRTTFQDVFCVAPGSYLKCKAGEPPTAHEFHSFSDDVDEAQYTELSQSPPHTIISRLGELFDESVSRMLMGDAPIGAFISGGIDSSMIAHSASQQAPSLSLFTSNVVGKYSELPQAQLVCRSIGRELQEAEFTPDMLIAEWAAATWHYEFPIVRHVNALPFMVVARLAHARGVKAVLTGEGADELFMGYPLMVAPRLRRIASAPVHALKKCYGVLPGVQNYLFPSPDKTVEAYLRLTVQDFERQRLRENGMQAFSFLSEKEAREQYLSIQSIREGLISLLHRNDRMGMSASIESRFPFLDERLVRFAINLPVKFKIAMTRRWHNYRHPFLEDKWILRRVADGRLPAAIVRKQKIGFPLFGHKHVRVRKGYFSDGYVSSIIGLSSAGEDYMLRSQNPYFIAKMVSIDLFGRLFAIGESIDTVTRRLLQYISVDRA